MSQCICDVEPNAVCPKHPPRELPSSTGSAAVHHVCCVCGHKWQSRDAKTEREVLKAVKVNKTGPYCDLCMYLTMARRHAEARGFVFADFVADWLTMKTPNAKVTDPAK